MISVSVLSNFVVLLTLCLAAHYFIALGLFFVVRFISLRGLSDHDPLAAYRLSVICTLLKGHSQYHTEYQGAIVVNIFIVGIIYATFVWEF